MRNIVFVLFFTVGVLHAWEVNTHRAIDRTAIEKVKPKNLLKFIDSAGIADNSYAHERFEGYGLTYFEYFNKKKSNDAMADMNQTFVDGKYQSLLEAGSMLEDAQWQNNALFGANGRFLNHFYNPQDGGDGLWWNANAVDWAKGLVSVGHLTDNEKRRIS